MFNVAVIHVLCLINWKFVSCLVDQ